MKKHVTILAVMAVLLLAALAASPAFGAAEGQAGPPATHIFVFNDGVDAQGAANSLARTHGLSVNNVYSHALSGMAAVVPQGRLNALAKDPRVAIVEANQIVEAYLPTGIDRVDAEENYTANIGSGQSVDVDVAIIDTGIDLDHPDLNVVAWTNCARKGPFNTTCKNDDSGANDGHGHGTHVAGTVAALDNGDSVVGMAPGARLWAVKVLGDDGSGYMNWIIAGIDYVASNDTIEVANMSLGCACSSLALDMAITNAVAGGVTFAVAAGNSMSDSSGYSPANHLGVITVSAMADFDGKPGGMLDQTVAFSICTEDTDDSFACFSNYGEPVDIAAPGVSILSTYMGGGTATMSGTSMASPHVAGAAALVKAANAGYSPADVLEELLATAIPQGAAEGFSGDPDSYAEPLLNVGGSWTPPPPPVLETISVTPAGQSIAVGETQQFSAMGAYDDSSVADITADVTWNSNSAAIATIDASGMATGMSTGAAGISASLEAVTSDMSTLTVTPPPDLISITVSPGSATIQAGETQQFIATGGYSDDSNADITGSVDWSSEPTAKATIDDSGLATRVAEGAAGISASLEGVTSNTAALTITAPPATGTIVSVDSITYAGEGGKNGDKHLLVTIGIVDDLDNAVESATVSILLTNTVTLQSWIGSGATGADGKVTFRLGNAPTGCYTTGVWSVIADGLFWDWNTGPANSYCKYSGSNSSGNGGSLQVE